jgi:hypothetical protein
MFRVALYGSLSGVLMHGLVNAYEEFLKTEKVRRFEHAKVNEFAAYELTTYTVARRFLYKPRGYDSRRAQRKVAFIVQFPMIFSLVIAGIFTSIVLGWSLEWFAVLGLLGAGVVLIESLSSMLAVPLPKHSPS